MFANVAFTGSRSLPAAFGPLVAEVVRRFAQARLFVGCAAGADQVVRLAAPPARLQVFRASRYGPGPPASRLVKRSVAMVKVLATSPAPLLVGFVSGPCPPGVGPSLSYFFGSGSGTWGTLAYAAHLEVPLAVFWCSAGTPQLPARWGEWLEGAGPLAGGWQLAPRAIQLSLC